MHQTLGAVFEALLQPAPFDTPRQTAIILRLGRIPEPATDLPYFYLAMARDPRVLIAHEGVHYYQLARAWAQSNPIRRQYYDSGPNEGIGFYAEEMLLQAGLFDDSPHSREIIYNFMRLRAVRVAVDVRLALGELSIDSAAEELTQRVPIALQRWERTGATDEIDVLDRFVGALST